MSLKNLNVRNWVLFLIILVAASTRFIPLMGDANWFNFTPVGAIALFAGTHFKRRWKAYAAPLLLLFVSIFLPISLARNSGYSKLDVYYYTFFPATLFVFFACIALIAHFYFIIALAVLLALILLIFLIAIVVFVGLQMDL